MKNIVVDTDIGTDVDDMIALAYAIKNKSLDAITIAHSQKGTRAKIARKLTRILGVDIPIFAGQREIPNEDDHWCGFEQNALNELELAENSFNFGFPVYDEKSILVCIAPMTNIAQQLKENPSIRKVKDVYIMGHYSGSHNFKVDLMSAEEVISQSWNKYFITKEVSEKIGFTRKELEEFKGTALGNLIYDSALRWLDYTGRDKALMYDVLTFSAAMQEGFIKFSDFGGEKISYEVNIDLKNKIMETLK
ncbi:nucleoside hydrolase [Candidatus Pacearchaeota archaeon]|nr:nucleoside hydrolase [Candidatus Pacearchaeota archaeon]